MTGAQYEMTGSEANVTSETSRDRKEPANEAKRHPPLLWLLTAWKSPNLINISVSITRS